MTRDARRASRTLAVVTAATTPVVMSTGRLGLIVGLAMLLGVITTCAWVEWRTARAGGKVGP